jgi:hypothetical protein
MVENLLSLRVALTRPSAGEAEALHLAASSPSRNGPQAGALRAARTSSVTPMTADETEAINTAILTASKSASDRDLRCR